MTTWEMNLEDAFDILEALSEQLFNHPLYDSIDVELSAARSALEQVDYLVSEV